jgi:hypothetical protein
MDEYGPPPEREQELRELQARAYGPHPDIQDDPDALARLAALESAHVSEHAVARPTELAWHEPVQATPETTVAVEAPTPLEVAVFDEPVPRRSVWQNAAAMPPRRLWLIVGSLAAMTALVYAVSWFAPQQPDATLQPTGVEADSSALSAVSYAPLAEVDVSTMRGYEPYRGLTMWVAENAQGSRCLLGTEGSTLHGIKCAPPEAELMIDFGAYPLDYTATYMDGLADGTVIRFRLNGDSVDAYLYPPPSADGSP